MSVEHDKSFIRSKAAATRDSISREARDKYEAQIHSRVCDLLQEFQAHNNKTQLVVAAYKSFRSEVALTEAGQESLLWVYPKMLKAGQMEFRTSSSFVANSLGVLEPGVGSQVVENQEIDVVLVPGLAFDHTGGRLGYGKGYYDRWLSGHRAVRVGIAFSEQVETKPVPQNSNDILMNYMVTENYTLQILGNSQSQQKVS